MNDFATLQQAVVSGNKEKILELLHEDFKSCRDNRGNTLLHWAFSNEAFSENELIEILDIFLDRGADINAQNNKEKSILHLAVERRMRDVIDFCLRKNADTNPKHERLNSIAHFAVEEECRKCRSSGINNFEVYEKESSNFIDWMVSRGFDFFSTKNIESFSPLYLANDLNLQHILLTLLKRTSDLPAVEQGQTPLIRAFIEKKNDLYPIENPWDDYPDPIRSTYYKSRYAYDIVKIILDKSKSIDEKTLHMAIRSAIKGQEEINVIDLLVQRITNVNLRINYGESLIETFANSFHGLTKDENYKNNMATLRTLINKCANINESDRSGQTLAQKIFIRQPTMETLKILKEVGADFYLNSPECDQNFLFLISDCSKEAGLIDFVMNEGDDADVNITHITGQTPLTIAILHENEFAACELIEHGARVKFSDSCDRSPIVIACRVGQLRVLEKLMERGATLNYKDRDNQTLLHLAAGHPRVVELLLKNGLDVNARDNSGKTPLHLATCDDVVEILFNHGARVDAVDERGNTPLYDALCRDKTRSIEALINCGADVQDPKVFKFAITKFEHFYHKNVPLKLRYLKRHLIKMTAVGLLEKMPYANKGIGAELQMFYEQCQAEVELLKNYFINDFTSLYDLLHKSRNRRCTYVDNEKLTNLLKDANNDKKFRNYFALILGCYNQAVARKTFLQLAGSILSKITHKNLPALCTDLIFMYLSNGDLLRFIQVYEDLTHSTLQVN